MVEKHTIKIPIIESFEGKRFYHSTLWLALLNCQISGENAMFMPEVVDTKIASPIDSDVWQSYYDTPSIKATGRTKKGNAVVVYAHAPNYLSTPKNIEREINMGLYDGAAEIPRDEFYRLLSLEDNKRVFVIDYIALKDSGRGKVLIEEALKHPQTIPFLGGEKRARAYLEKCEDLGCQTLDIHYSYDLNDRPLGRLLLLGGTYICGNNTLFGSGKFLGSTEDFTKNDSKRIEAFNPQMTTGSVIRYLQKHNKNLNPEKAKKLLRIVKEFYQKE